MIKDSDPNEHCFPTPDPEEGHVYVRERETKDLLTEFRFVMDLAAHMAAEIQYRNDHPEDFPTIPTYYQDATDAVLERFEYAKRKQR